MPTEIKDNYVYLENDLCFKYVFSKENILKDFINSFLAYLNQPERFYFTKITSQEYIVPDNKKCIGYYGDIVATLSNESILSLEMYSGSFKEKNYNKSYAYMCRLFDQNIKNSKTYQGKKVISLNIMNGNYKRKNNCVVNKYHFSNALTGETIDNGNTMMYLIRIDKLKNIPYTVIEERFIKWLRIITSKDMREMEEIGKGDAIMKEAMEFVAKWNDASAKDGLNRTIQKMLEENADEVEEKTTKKKTIEIAKNLLLYSDNPDIEYIKKATGLSEKAINRLQKQLN